MYLRRRLRVREPVLHGVRHAEYGAEHSAVQRRRGVRAMLQRRVRPQEGGPEVVQARRHGDRHRHQLLPAQLGSAQRQWRLVQPAAPPLRHGAAGMGEDGRVPWRHHPSNVQKVYYTIDRLAKLINLCVVSLKHKRISKVQFIINSQSRPLCDSVQGSMRSQRWSEVHHQRARLLQPRAGGQCCRRWLHQIRGREGRRFVRVAADGPQLGRAVAFVGVSQRENALVQGDDHGRPNSRVPKHRATRMEVRPDVCKQIAVQMTDPTVERVLLSTLCTLLVLYAPSAVCLILNYVVRAYKFA
jgi:hypothetical protein